MVQSCWDVPIQPQRSVIPHPETEIPGPVSDKHIFRSTCLRSAPASKEVGGVSSLNNIVTGVRFPSQNAAVSVPLGGTEDVIRAPDVGWEVGRHRELITHVRVEARLRSEGSHNPQQGRPSSSAPC